MGKRTVKSTTGVVRRIGLMTGANEQTLRDIERMIDSLIQNRDRIISYQKTKLKERTVVIEVNRVSGALRDTIQSHGPITKELIGSAAKRICGQLIQVKEPCKNLDNVIVEE